MRAWLKIIALASVFVLIVPAITPAPKAKASSSFIMGGDVSMLHEVEQRGGKFYDNGVEKNALEILSDHGMNAVRLRLWVDPYDSDGNPYGGGTNDLATTISLAQRAKALGMDVLLNFHFSDFWADPGKQNKPKAWKNLTYSQLLTTVYDYTNSVITQMKAAGALPDMVQVGNEASSGILWDDGKVGGGIDDFTQLGELLTSAINGIHAALAPGEDIEIVLHLDHGGDNNLYTWWFDKIEEQNVDYDIIGLTYYPFWHGTMGELAYNLNAISNRYNKDVMIVETAYGFTLDDGDGLGNSFYTTEEEVGGYPASVAGQTAYLRDLKEIVQDVPNNHGRGIFWWEPTWLPVEGAHWGSEAGKLYNNDTGLLSNPWDNQTLFDFSGNLLSTVSVFTESTPVNLVSNPSFEADGWTTTPTAWNRWAANTASYQAIKVENNGVTGSYKLTHWLDTAYEASTYQNITGLSNGTYTLSAWVLNSGGQDTVQLYAKNYGGSERNVDLPVSPEKWVKVKIENIQVTNGRIEIGVYSKANANNWMNLDHVKLYKTN
ncbi:MULTISPECIES: glycoside hydrolase family 53 protein [Paenibacillus]|uniref:glycoside hydrolase family 53 protein n=1 Tax=Paenibacillus TaxID=44249 RepID=UPI0001AFDC66|nr:glycosyl hydrolase 53 family protein [Paenibacillus sp. oral taxon 786]EES72540.1 arabinogalactan endo-1,4-beta-galactosidase family protein [Paenibacillus sp. oral taxon 786 str. D14]